ncbi:MAG: hypothetical protein GF353_20645 [Candidatus Lokiarchaeota archaeon]|nr:hypothetical protein [Candidatus Lokiarchaeota archaeon]
MNLFPNLIYEDYLNGKINRNTAINLLRVIIENSDNPLRRITSLKYLDEISPKNDSLFSYIENLLISDANAELRFIAADMIRYHFLKKSFRLLKWLLNYEDDYHCSIKVIESLVEINSLDVRKLFIKELKEISKIKYLDSINTYRNKFRKDVKTLLKGSYLKVIKISELADILINFKTIRALIDKFYTVYYGTKNAHIIKLDFSEVGWNINIWKQKYAKRITNLQDITGLFNLKHLNTLDLSNNRLKYIKNLSKLKNLQYLYLTNNRLDDPINLEYLKKIGSLKYLDIKGNRITTYLSKHDFGHLHLRTDGMKSPILQYYFSQLKK